MKKRSSIIIAVIAGLFAGAIGMYSTGVFLGPAKEVKEGAPAGVGEKKIIYWHDPMDPAYISDKPGKSPMGMDLTPVYEDEEETAEPGTVKIDPVTVQNIGVRTSTVERVKLTKTIRTVGRVDYDEKRLYRLHTKIDGWVEKLYFDTTGAAVRKGDILLEFYSPKLVSAQEEFLLAKKFEGRMEEVGRESLL